MPKTSFYRKPTGDKPRRSLPKSLAGFLTMAVGWVLWTVISHLPRIGDPLAPTSFHVSSRYLEKGVQETGLPNPLAAVLLDYRSFDFFLLSFFLLTTALLIFWLSWEEAKTNPPSSFRLTVVASGAILSLAIGLDCSFCGNNFLDYDSLPLPLPPAQIRMGGALLLILGFLLGAGGLAGLVRKSLVSSPEKHLGR